MPHTRIKIPIARSTATAARGGFSLIEMLIVLAVIAALMAMGWYGVGALRERQRVQRTQLMVQTLAGAISAYRDRVLLVRASPSAPGVAHRLWDVDGDGVLDGDPELDEAFGEELRAAALAAGYRGALQLPVERMRSDRMRRIVDGWGHPLRLAAGSQIYGPLGMGVWSLGRDQKPDTADDIRSWSADGSQ